MMLIDTSDCVQWVVPARDAPDFRSNDKRRMPTRAVVEAMRAAMFGIYQNDFWIAMGELALFLVPAALLGYAIKKTDL